MAAAHEGKSVKEFLLNLGQARLEELERKGILAGKMVAIIGAASMILGNGSSKMELL